MRVELVDPPANLPPRPQSQAQRRGIRYEQRVHEALTRKYPRYVPGPWLRVWAGGGPAHYLQPDGLHFDFNLGTLTLIEVKYRHCLMAAGQMLRYARALQVLFPDFKVEKVEVVRWFEPEVPWPWKIRLLQEPVGQGEGIWICRGE
jgi:hypothetical protein